ncbi:MAG: hypothetical protein R2939_09920 [Kofleriaceae bacterium]
MTPHAASNAAGRAASVDAIAGAEGLASTWGGAGAAPGTVDATPPSTRSSRNAA